MRIEYVRIHQRIMGYLLSLRLPHFYLCPGRRPRAQVIKCVGFFFCIMFPPLENGQIAQ